MGVSPSGDPVGYATKKWLETRYQLVLQFPITDTSGLDFDRLTRLESELDGANGLYEVDGNDIGSGEMNIFLLTDEPDEAFNAVKLRIPTACRWRAAYRDQNGDDFSPDSPDEIEYR